MGPRRYRGKRGGGGHGQRDTPVKAPLGTRVSKRRTHAHAHFTCTGDDVKYTKRLKLDLHLVHQPNNTGTKETSVLCDLLSGSRRLVHQQRYETLPEEPEMEEMDLPEVASIKLVPSRSIRQKLEDEALRAPQTSAQPDSPAGLQRTPEASEPGHMTPPNPTVTLGSITSSGTESDPTVSCDEEEEEEELSVTPSSSLPSPELLRAGGCEAMRSFKEELLGLHLHVKNSTLLDVSHAESIRMHHSPNLSHILGTSTIQAEKNGEINKSREPDAESNIHADPFKSEWKTPPKAGESPVCPSREDAMDDIGDRILLPGPTSRRPIMYKKKVSFKVPVTAEAPEPKLSAREDAERPASDATFFDFKDAADRNAFFEGLRTRCEELRRAPLFPLTALEWTEAPSM
uniref:uncharacterized protein LOC120822733 isoform X2 n=1 Tax=Gasterosteus aculeatus aculeatus TaxID=481459 RepID=UPI001A9905DE|nr:uncharacterized protein LOC120822733 isoform X2 [Gasterosteus aculeatus aculeatus]